MLTSRSVGARGSKVAIVLSRCGAELWTRATGTRINIQVCVVSENEEMHASMLRNTRVSATNFRLKTPHSFPKSSSMRCCTKNTSVPFKQKIVIPECFFGSLMLCRAPPHPANTIELMFIRITNNGTTPSSRNRRDKNEKQSNRTTIPFSEVICHTFRILNLANAA